MTPLRIASASVCIGAALAMISSTLAAGPVSSAERKIPRPPNGPDCRPALTFAGGCE